MADPQENTTAAGQTRARGDAQPPGSPEPRSFDEARARAGADANGGAAAETMSQAAQPLVDGGRELAEQSRRASRQMADVWRQAVDPLMAMQYDISQWFDDVFRHTFGFRNTPGAAALRPFGHISAINLFGLPPADMKETETAHVLAIELPGLSREDVDLAIDGDALIVSGHKAEESDDVSATYRMSERRYGRFERAFPLPPDVERGKIEAQFRDGLLKITLPKNPDVARAKARIDIKG
ncbi:MAG TPA: Hsp20/alpha crystallin family protein [Caulobacteraceae bacterium]